MTHTQTFLLLSTLLLGLGSTACGGDSGQEPSPDPSTEAEAPAPEAGSEEVAYEPAFPEDVSAEGLSDEDVAQQESHSHGGEEHTHGEGEDHDDHEH